MIKVYLHYIINTYVPTSLQKLIVVCARVTKYKPHSHIHKYLNKAVSGDAWVPQESVGS